MAHTIGLNDKMNIKFQVPRRFMVKFTKMMEDNSFSFVEKPTYLNILVNVTVQNVNLKKAELLRQLLKNITVYD